MSRVDQVRSQQRAGRTPCAANPNGYDYHRWHRRLNRDGERTTAQTECSFCHRVEEIGTCPPHQPTVGYACPGFVRIVTCAVCLAEVPEAHL